MQDGELRMKNYDDPEGVEAISRGLSKAKPPESNPQRDPPDPEGLPANLCGGGRRHSAYIVEGFLPLGDG